MNKMIPEIDWEAAVAAGRANEEALRAKGPEPSSACIWLPALQRAGEFNIPRTEMVEFHPDSLWPIMDDCEPKGFPTEQLEAACERIGYPIFLRTDLASAKHEGPAAYRADSRDDLKRCLYATFEDNACKDIAWALRAIMVREFLVLEAPFVAFRGLPIAREWRIFVNQDDAMCSHFYWPAEAFHSWQVPEGWQSMRRNLSEPPADLEDLSRIALRAAQAVGSHAWSVDFARDIHGKWWLIDMARAEQSWHPTHELRGEA